MANDRSRLGRTLGELRRRHVFRVVGIYAIAAWGMLQVADVILPALLIPPWVMTLLVVMVIVGFPLTAVLAWFYDITADGVVRTPEMQPGPDTDGAITMRWNWRWLDYLIIAGLAAILIFVLVHRSSESIRGQPERSIAVLPFADLSPKQDTGYFCDGMAEAILDALAPLSGLQVAARTSSFSFRDSDADVREVARALGVGTLLEGSVRKDGNRIRISARLVDGRTGHQLWSDTYDRELEDVFAVQDSISRAIVDVLRVQVLDEQKLVEVPTGDQRAYEEYLRGRDQLRNGNTVEDYQLAIDRFERALVLDDSFGLARAGICTAYWPQYELVGDSELADQAIAACREAQATSDRAETLVALGNVYRATGRVTDSRELFSAPSKPNPTTPTRTPGWLSRCARTANWKPPNTTCGAPSNWTRPTGGITLPWPGSPTNRGRSTRPSASLRRPFGWRRIIRCRISAWGPSTITRATTCAPPRSTASRWSAIPRPGPIPTPAAIISTPVNTPRPKRCTAARWSCSRPATSAGTAFWPKRWKCSRTRTRTRSHRTKKPRSGWATSGSRSTPPTTRRAAWWPATWPRPAGRPRLCRNSNASSRPRT